MSNSDDSVRKYEQRIAELEAALRDAEAGEGETANQIAKLRQQVSSLRNELGPLQQGQSALSEQVSQTRQETDTLNERLTERTRSTLAFAAIERAAANGAPFREAYSQLNRARPDDAAVSALQVPSGRETPTLSQLKQRFETLAPEAAARDSAEDKEPGWINTLFGETVSVRRSNPDSETAKALAAARQALSRNDLEAAISALNALPQSSRPVFEDWLSDARARQQLESALDALRLKLISD